MTANTKAQRLISRSTKSRSRVANYHELNVGEFYFTE